jgi:hypothetical protein
MTSNFTSQEDAEDLAIVLREAREIQRVSVADLAYRTGMRTVDVLEFEAARVFPARDQSPSRCGRSGSRLSERASRGDPRKADDEPHPRGTAGVSDNHLATGLAAERYSGPNTRTPQQLIAHLRQAPVELPEGPAADDS